ncbi:MAG: hypothetical protein IK066_02155 [Kiritimatiellae bacterium]|nr:hypothetical protein [Kiritimatiellia bacterium]
MATALWHSLMEHPIPAREPEACFRHKLALVARRAGSATLRDQGFEKTSAWIDSISTPLYAHLPPLPSKPPIASSRRAGPGRKSLHGP